jgi:hypothetical protein
MIVGILFTPRSGNSSTNGSNRNEQEEKKEKKSIAEEREWVLI